MVVGVLPLIWFELQSDTSRLVNLPNAGEMVPDSLL